MKIFFMKKIFVLVVVCTVNVIWAFSQNTQWFTNSNGSGISTTGNVTIDYGTFLVEWPGDPYGYQMKFDPSKKFFRVGNLPTQITNPPPPGSGSIALGDEALASGYRAFAGTQSNAAGDYSVALGGANSEIGGFSSFAWGLFARTSGWYSSALGYQANASGYSSFAIGEGTNATAPNSMAIGYKSKATNTAAIAVGNGIAAGAYSAALNAGSTGTSAQYSTALNKGMADGAYSFASGISYSSGQYSTAIGYSQANADYSFSSGYLSGAYGVNSSAIGAFVSASGKNSMVLGSGVSNSTQLTNKIDNSLMIGFNTSTLPSVFVGPASAANETEPRFGYVGIGTTTPKHALSVNGTVLAKSAVLVENLSGEWPDYVFSKNYSLPSLSDVEKFIESNHHLPEVPSQEQIKKEGLNLGEMELIMMKKIEELTLHVIQIDKENKQIRLENEELNKRMNELTKGK
jgi:hypothetical protein